MVLQTSGSISLANVQSEFGGANPASLSEYYAGGSYVAASSLGFFKAIPSSGTITLRDFYGAEGGVPATSYYLEFTGITSNATNIFCNTGVKTLNNQKLYTTYSFRANADLFYFRNSANVTPSYIYCVKVNGVQVDTLGVEENCSTYTSPYSIDYYADNVLFVANVAYSGTTYGVLVTKRNSSNTITNTRFVSNYSTTLPAIKSFNLRMSSNYAAYVYSSGNTNNQLQLIKLDSSDLSLLWAKYLVFSNTTVTYSADIVATTAGTLALVSSNYDSTLARYVINIVNVDTTNGNVVSSSNKQMYASSGASYLYAADGDATYRYLACRHTTLSISGAYILNSSGNTLDYAIQFNSTAPAGSLVVFAPTKHNDYINSTNLLIFLEGTTILHVYIVNNYALIGNINTVWSKKLTLNGSLSTATITGSSFYNGTSYEITIQAGSYVIKLYSNDATNGTYGNITIADAVTLGGYTLTNNTGGGGVPYVTLGTCSPTLTSYTPTQSLNSFTYTSRSFFNNIVEPTFTTTVI